MQSDIDLIGELAANMLGRTFCPLGDAAAMPIGAFVAKFRDEFEAKLKQSRAAEEVAGLGGGVSEPKDTMADPIKFTIDGQEVQSAAGHAAD